MARIGLVTVLFKSDDVLEGFLKSLSSQSYFDYHLYIVDNTPSLSTDNLLIELIERYPIPSFSHYKSDSNFGIAKGNNVGIEAALKDGCEFVLLLNNDIEFKQPDLFELLIKQAYERRKALIVPKIFFYDTKKIWMAGGHFQWAKAMAFHVGEGKNDKKKYNKNAYFNYAPTCFMLIRSSVFNEIGLMDEKYFVYFDDTDFVYRAIEKGYSIYYCASLEILHKVGSSTGGDNSVFGIYYGNRNRIYFIRKHYDLLKKIIAFTFVLCTRVIKYLRYNQEQRKYLNRGLKDGFAMKMNDL